MHFKEFLKCETSYEDELLLLANYCTFQIYHLQMPNLIKQLHRQENFRLFFSDNEKKFSSLTFQSSSFSKLLVAKF
jgi:hypothetical protein